GSDLYLVDLRKGGKGTPLVLGADVRPGMALLHEKVNLLLATNHSPRSGGKLSAWKLSGSALKRLPFLDKERDKVKLFSLNPRGDMLALGTDSKPGPQVKLISLDTGAARFTLKLPSAGPSTTFLQSLDFDPQANLLAAVVNQAGPILIDLDQGKIA